MESHINVLGTALECCCLDPLTGFYRDGHCRTGVADTGTHVICATMTESFLRFTLGRGNDLSTPRPEFRFPGLKPGDRWCLCAVRWREALEAGTAPPVHLAATDAKALDYVTLDQLRAHAADVQASEATS
jgi:uncharacterized protein (DUF2237 family)